MLNSKILCEEVSPDNSKARDAQLLVYWYLQSRHIKPRIMVPETMMESRFPALTCSISGPTWTRVESILILGMASQFSPPSLSSSWLNLLWPFVGPSREWAVSDLLLWSNLPMNYEETQPSITYISLTSHSFSTMSLSCWGEEEGTVMFQTHW